MILSGTGQPRAGLILSDTGQPRAGLNMSDTSQPRVGLNMSNTSQPRVGLNMSDTSQPRAGLSATVHTIADMAEFCSTDERRDIKRQRRFEATDTDPTSVPHVPVEWRSNNNLFK